MLCEGVYNIFVANGYLRLFFRLSLCLKINKLMKSLVVSFLILAWGLRTAAQDPLPKTANSVSVLNFGAKPNDSLSDNEAFQKAVNAAKVVLIPAGTYLLSSVDVPANTYLKPQGKVTIKQERNPAGNKDLRIFYVRGSNVTIENIIFRGNIDIDAGEQNHAIFTYPGDSVLKNIKISGVSGYDLRGDVICLGGQNNHAYISQAKISDIYGKNIYRNTISLTAVDGVTISNVRSENAGLFGIDLEGDANGAPLKNVTITDVKLERLGFIGEGKEPCTNVVVKNCVIDGAKFTSTPSHPHAEHDYTHDALLIRYSQNLKFENLTIANAWRYSVFALEGVGNSNNLSFEKLTIKNSGTHYAPLKNATYWKYADNIAITDLEVDVKAGGNWGEFADRPTAQPKLGKLKVNPVQ
jgi:hypothetical protein